jgi:hypothetical protein
MPRVPDLQFNHRIRAHDSVFFQPEALPLPGCKEARNGVSVPSARARPTGKPSDSPLGQDRFRQRGEIGVVVSDPDHETRDQNGECDDGCFEHGDLLSSMYAEENPVVTALPGFKL